MKKMFSKKLLLLVVMVACSILCITTPIQAAKKSAIVKKADTAQKSITSTANYYGWEVSAKTTKSTKTKVVRKLTVTDCSNRYFKYTQTTKKSGKKYTTSYKGYGQKRTAADVKASIKKYSDSATVKGFLKNRAAKKANTLSAYGKARGWTVKTSSTATKKQGTAILEFNNQKSGFSAMVAVVRNKKAPKTVFSIMGASGKWSGSSEKAIEAWLTKYAYGTTATVTQQQMIDFAKNDASAIVQTAETNYWTVKSTGIGTSTKVELKFENERYNFSATVAGVDNGNGKAEGKYTITGSITRDCDKAEILSWITQYKVIPDDTPTIISGDDLAKAAKADAAYIKQAAEAKSWTVGEKELSSTKIELDFSNDTPASFSATIEAVDESGKIALRYTRTGKSGQASTCSKSDILKWIEDYAADDDGPTVNVTEDKLSDTAKAEAAAIKEAAEAKNWSVEKTNLSKTKVSLEFENIHSIFSATVEAVVEGGKITIKYTRTGEKTVSCEKAAILDWIEKYAVDDDEQPSITPDPVTGEDEPSKKPTVSIDDLDQAAEEALANIVTEARERGWEVTAEKATSETQVAILTTFTNATYTFYASIEARVVGLNGSQTHALYFGRAGKDPSAMSYGTSSRITDWLEKYKVTTSGGASELGTEELNEAASTALQELVNAALDETWQITELDPNTTEAIHSVKAYNAAHQATITVQATDDNGAIMLNCTLNGTAMSKDEILSWLEENAGPSCVIPPAEISSEELDAAAEAALAELITIGEEKDWQTASLNAEEIAGEAGILFKNTKVSFRVVVKATDAGDGETINLAYFLQDLAVDRGLIVSWFDKYSDTNSGEEPGDNDGDENGDGDEDEPNIGPTNRTEELKEAATAAITEVLIEAAIRDWTSEEVQNTGNRIMMRMIKDGRQFYVIVHAELLDGEVVTTYGLIHDGDTDETLVGSFDELLHEFDTAGSTTQPGTDRPTTPNGQVTSPDDDEDDYQEKPAA